MADIPNKHRMTALNPDFVSFFVFALIASVTPGPNNIILATVGARHGALRGLPSLAGTALGFGMMLFTVALGLGAVLLSSQYLLHTLRVLGAGGLLWLAWAIATSPTSSTYDDVDSHHVFGFVQAILFQWINPKAWIVSVSIVGSYVVVGDGALVRATVLSAVFIVAAFLGCAPWLLFGSAIRSQLKSRNAAKAFNLVLGIGLALSVLMIIV